MNCKSRSFLVGLAVSMSALVAGSTNGQEIQAPAALTSQGANTEIQQLQAAADADPKNVKAQLTYAQRLFEKGMTLVAWRRLRVAYEVAPEDPGVLMGLQAVMNDYKLNGLLNVGIAEQEVLNLFGKPHHTRKMPWGVRHVYGMMAVDFRDEKIHELVKLLGATDALFDASHVIDVELDGRPWRVGVREKADALSTAHLFVQGESIARWTEMVTIERILHAGKVNSMKDVLAKAQEQIQAVDSNAKIHVVQEDTSTAIFAVMFPAGSGQPGRQQIVRLWMEARDVHRLAYTHQGEVPPNAHAEKWLMILKNAELKPFDPTSSPAPYRSKPKPSAATNPIHEMAEEIRTDFRKAIQFKPTEQALAAIAATAEDQQKLVAYCESIYKKVSQGGSPTRPEQSQIILFGPDLDVMPGGYKSVRDHFKADVKFYGFKYVVPGETSGMSFDGAFEVGGKWYFLPKAHRAFR
ncbi:MAG: hypothetical protein ABL921_23870 [Pirellula sp.]